MGDGATVLEAYAAHLGIPIHDPDCKWGDYPVWDGTALFRPPDAEQWAHEIAHWLIASPDQRLLVDYGWGHDAHFGGYDPADPDPDLRSPGLDRLPWPAPDAEWPPTEQEWEASVLGFAFLVRVGEPAPWDLYGFCVYDRSPRGSVTRRVDPVTYELRRRLQPHVAAFEAWRQS